MSSSVLPSLAGTAYQFDRAVQFKTRKQVSISGKETRIADWSYPRYQWTLSYNALRQSSSPSYAEYAQLEGFFEGLVGGWDSFLFADPDDSSVTAQTIGVGDGSTTQFQLQRTFGGASTPILAPNAISGVFNNGSSVTFSSTAWGTTTPGVVTITAPAAGHIVSASFSYYFPCRFDDDTMTFSKLMKSVYENKKVSFTSIK